MDGSIKQIINGKMTSRDENLGLRREGKKNRRTMSPTWSSQDKQLSRDHTHARTHTYKTSQQSPQLLTNVFYPLVPFCFYLLLESRQSTHSTSLSLSSRRRHGALPPITGETNAITVIKPSPVRMSRSNMVTITELYFFLLLLLPQSDATGVGRQVHTVASRMFIIILSSAAGSLIVDHALRTCFFPVSC